MLLRDVLASPDLQGLFGVKPVRQTLPNARGICCLVTALRYMGMHVHEQMLVDVIGTNAVTGFEIPTVIRYLSSKKLVATAWTDYPLDLLLGRTRAKKLTLMREASQSDQWCLPVGVEPFQRAIVCINPAREQGTVFSRPLDEFSRSWQESERCVILIDRPSRGVFADRQPQRVQTARIQLESYEKTQQRTARSLASAP